MGVYSLLGESVAVPFDVHAHLAHDDPSIVVEVANPSTIVKPSSASMILGGISGHPTWVLGDRENWVLGASGFAQAEAWGHPPSQTFVLITRDPSAPVGIEREMLCGAIAAFVALKGGCVLHASAVDIPDVGTVGIFGPSQSGKSTLAALLCRAGASMVADDAVRIGCARAYTGLCALRLRGDAEAISPVPSLRTPDGRASWHPELAPEGSQKLVALITPNRSQREGSESEGSEGKVRTMRLGPSEAIGKLMANCRTSGWRDEEVLRTHLREFASVVASVGVFELNLQGLSLLNDSDRITSELLSFAS